MKYFLVALFDKNSNKYVENVQRQLCKKFKLYKKQQALHITLEVIDEPDLDAIDSIISDIIKPYKRFKVELNNDICFDSLGKSMNMKVENKGYITRLTRNITEKLKTHGFRVKGNNGDLHVALGNANYSSKKLINDKSQIAWEYDTTETTSQMAKVDRFEIWRAINHKKSQTIKCYDLKEY